MLVRVVNVKRELLQVLVQSPNDFDVANAALERSLNVMSKEQVQALADKINTQLNVLNKPK